MSPAAGTVVLAVNPRAGRGRGLEHAERAAGVLRVWGLEPVVLAAADLGSLLGLLRQHLRDQPAPVRAVVAVGGDGVVQAVLGVLVGLGPRGADVPLGLVPCGTGNDLARHLGIPREDPEAAAGRILRRLDGPPPPRLDVGRARTGDGRTVHFGTVLAAGFDAAVNERANRRPHLRGAARYLTAMLVELRRLRPLDYRLEIVDAAGRTRSAHRPGLLLDLANTSSFGGGLRIAPDARADDGLLELVGVDPLGRARLLGLLPALLAGRHTRLPCVRVERVRSVVLEAPGVVAYADGERAGPTPLRVDVLPGAVGVLA